jgi:hypothetical protein
VDGFDEMALEATNIGHVLPVSLPPYVHVVVSSRPEPAVAIGVNLEHPLWSGQTHPLEGLEESEVQVLLEKQGAVANESAHLAGRILNITGGQPLFVRFISKEVAEDGEKALECLEEHSPAGVEEYFKQQFRLLDIAIGGELTWHILGIFVVAEGGLTKAELADLLQVSQRKIRIALESIRRYLLGSETLTLMHLELARVVASELSPAEQGAYRDELLDWGGRYDKQGWPGETPPHVLEHYAAYLYKSLNRELLYGLISKRYIEV